MSSKQQLLEKKYHEMLEYCKEVCSTNLLKARSAGHLSFSDREFESLVFVISSSVDEAFHAQISEIKALSKKLDAESAGSDSSLSGKEKSSKKAH